MTNHGPGGSYLMLNKNSMVTGERPLLNIGFKYNYCMVISFVATEDVVSTKSGTTYLYNYPDQFNNVSVHLVSCILVMYKLFGSVNEVEYHNKSRQSDLALDKFWAT